MTSAQILVWGCLLFAVSGLYQVLRGRWALGGAILTLSMMMGLTGLILAKLI